MEHVLDYFENTVSCFPDKAAVSCKGKGYTFRELRDRAVQLSCRIRMLTPSPGNPVIVVVNRDADTLVGFLAVLYSGSFYVPMDPDLPLKKKLSILSDCNPKVIVCEKGQQQVLEGLNFTGTVLAPEEEPGEEAAALPGACPTESFCPDDPIYMVYTSGSTGKPKGVLKSHRAVCSFMKAFTETFALTSEEVIGNQTPFFFDASAKDIYLMLFTGATLEIIPSEKFIFGPGLIEYLNEKEITYVCWVPTALSIVTQMNTFDLVRPKTLRKVFFVGETFPIKQLRRWVAALPELTFVNLYGSTEISGISCYYRIDTSKEPESLPMGKPLPNCRVFLYDNEKSEVITESDRLGEVCVISDALALEYYHDPEKTAAVFVEMDSGCLSGPASASRKNPTDIANETDGLVRVLKTGDLARLDKNGNLVFSSRKDFQIKLQGRRIELGEIESVTDTLPEIARCCCLFNTERQALRLYVEPVKGCSLTGRQVRSALKPLLSDYMLPSKVIILEQMPINANGKIDRNYLKNL